MEGACKRTHLRGPKANTNPLKRCAIGKTINTVKLSPHSRLPPAETGRRKRLQPNKCIIALTPLHSVLFDQADDVHDILFSLTFIDNKFKDTFFKYICCYTTFVSLFEQQSITAICKNRQAGVNL
jgi:hypothetical protein